MGCPDRAGHADGPAIAGRRRGAGAPGAGGYGGGGGGPASARTRRTHASGSGGRCRGLFGAGEHRFVRYFPDRRGADRTELFRRDDLRGLPGGMRARWLPPGFFPSVRRRERPALFGRCVCDGRPAGNDDDIRGRGGRCVCDGRPVGNDDDIRGRGRHPPARLGRPAGHCGAGGGERRTAAVWRDTIAHPAGASRNAEPDGGRAKRARAFGRARDARRPIHMLHPAGGCARPVLSDARVVRAGVAERAGSRRRPPAGRRRQRRGRRLHRPGTERPNGKRRRDCRRACRTAGRARFRPLQTERDTARRKNRFLPSAPRASPARRYRRR